MAEPRQTWRLPLTAIAGFLLGVVFSVGGNELGLTRTAPPQASATAEPADPAAGDPVLPISQDRPSTASRSNPVVEVAARAAPAVVSIGCEVPTQSPFQIFYSGRSTSTSQGSGAVIRADGVVLTNAHVVEGATRITATLPDETSYEATVVGLDSELDLAVLQLEGAQGLPTIPLGSSSDLLLGETVIAIGNPFGLGHTLTTGVVSSRSRTLEVGERVFQDYVQTDAGINPGNSGGPLLNIHGELIGINTAIRRDAENIGFAIPVDRAAKVARDLLRYGSVRAPWLGIAVSDIGGPRYAGTPIAEGALLVERIHAGGGARAAGLLQDDIILRIDDRSIHSRADLNLRLASLKPGETVRVAGLRAGQPFQLSVTTASCPEGLGAELMVQDLGVQVQTVASVDQRTLQELRLRTNSGLLVIDTSATGGFAEAGLRQGDVILAVHGQAVREIEQLEAALLRAVAAHRDSVLLTVQRGKYRGHVEVSF
jgi:serine protease Do